MFRIRIRIRPKMEQIPILFFLIFFCIRFKTYNDVFFVIILSLLFAYMKQNKWFLHNFGWFVCEFITIFFWYPDPDPRFLMRIRIRPNDTDPTGSGFETLITINKVICVLKLLWIAATATELGQFKAQGFIEKGDHRRSF